MMCRNAWCRSGTGKARQRNSNWSDKPQRARCLFHLTFNGTARASANQKRSGKIPRASLVSAAESWLRPRAGTKEEVFLMTQEPIQPEEEEDKNPAHRFGVGRMIRKFYSAIRRNVWYFIVFVIVVVLVLSTLTDAAKNLSNLGSARSDSERARDIVDEVIGGYELRNWLFEAPGSMKLRESRRVKLTISSDAVDLLRDTMGQKYQSHHGTL